MVQAAGVKVIFASLTGDILLDMLVAALLTVLCYSSLAVVLLIATLAALNVIALPVALGLVLGANLGSGLLGMISTLRSPPEARRVTLGNFLFKLIGCVIAIPAAALPRGADRPAWASTPRTRSCCSTSPSTSRSPAMFLGFTGPIARVAERLLPDRPVEDDPSKPRHLDPSALGTPALAIACAAREALRIGDIVEGMLTGMLQVLKSNDRALAARDPPAWTTPSTSSTRRPSSTSRRSRGRRWRCRRAGAGPTSSRSRSTWSRSATSSSGSSLDIEDKMIDKGRRFSEAGMTEICDLHARLHTNLKLGLSVFLTGDLAGAQQLLAQKVLFRDLERVYADAHLERLAGQAPRQHRDLVAASRPHLGPAPHQLAHLLDRLPDARARRRAGAHAAQGAAARARAAAAQRAREGRPRAAQAAPGMIPAPRLPPCRPVRCPGLPCRAVARTRPHPDDPT